MKLPTYLTYILFLTLTFQGCNQADKFETKRIDYSKFDTTLVSKEPLYREPEACKIYSDSFSEKIFFSSSDFQGEVIPLLKAVGFEISNTGERWENVLSDIMIAQRGQNKILYFEGSDFAFSADITTKNFVFHNDIRIGDSLEIFNKKSGYKIPKYCSLVELYDNSGMGVIKFYFRKQILDRVEVDFDI